MRLLGLLFVTGAVVVAFGCSDDGGGSADGGMEDAALPPRPVAHPMDDILRLNHLQAKGTHNSYHVETTDGSVEEWHYTHAPLDEQLDAQGVRKLELDVHWDGTNQRHRVLHVPLADEGTVCELFTECLQDIKGWSDFHPGHHPIFVMIEPKDQDGSDPATVTGLLESLEQEIQSVLPDDRLVTPTMVRGEAATLVEAIDAQGWPTLAQARGRVMFFLDCQRELCVEYANEGAGLAGRLLFAASEPGDPWEAVRVLNDPVGDAAAIASAVEADRFVRTFSDGIADVLMGEDHLQEALDSGAHVLSSDVPAPRDDVDYVMEIPGGTPSRCNPLVAPSDCDSTDIEDPALLEGP